MNPFGSLDKSTALGYLKGGGSLDPDVAHARYTSFVSGARMMRVFLLLPLIGGGLALLVGIPLSFIIVGIPMVLIGGLALSGAWWARRRLASNIRVMEAVYAEYAPGLSGAAAR